jgi:prevent-host-death family protein
MQTSASIARARAELSALVNLVAHGKQRVVLTSRGRPKAALIGLEDLSALEELPAAIAAEESMLEADLFVERVRRRRLGALLSDSADDLAAIRESVP